jgi:hypothetical protein
MAIPSKGAHLRFILIANNLQVLLINTKSIAQCQNVCVSCSEEAQNSLSDSCVLNYILENKVFIK